MINNTKLLLLKIIVNRILLIFADYIILEGIEGKSLALLKF